MSYCMFENTLNELVQIKAFLEDAVNKSKSLQDLRREASSSYESSSMRELRNELEEILELYEDLDFWEGTSLK